MLSQRLTSLGFGLHLAGSLSIFTRGIEWRLYSTSVAYSIRWMHLIGGRIDPQGECLSRYTDPVVTGSGWLLWCGDNTATCGLANEAVTSSSSIFSSSPLLLLCNKNNLNNWIIRAVCSLHKFISPLFQISYESSLTGSMMSLPLCIFFAIQIVVRTPFLFINLNRINYE